MKNQLLELFDEKNETKPSKITFKFAENYSLSVNSIDMSDQPKADNVITVTRVNGIKTTINLDNVLFFSYQI